MGALPRSGGSPDRDFLWSTEDATSWPPTGRVKHGWMEACIPVCEAWKGKEPRQLHGIFPTTQQNLLSREVSCKATSTFQGCWSLTIACVNFKPSSSHALAERLLKVGSQTVGSPSGACLRPWFDCDMSYGHHYGRDTRPYPGHELPYRNYILYGLGRSLHRILSSKFTRTMQSSSYSLLAEDPGYSKTELLKKVYRK